MKVWSKQDLHITRAIGAIDGELPASALLDRMEANGVPRISGYVWVTRAVKIGLLIRAGECRTYVYRLNTEYVPAERKFAPPAFRPACPHCQRPMPRARRVIDPAVETRPKRVVAPRTTPPVKVTPEPDAYVGPAFDRTALLPHLGTPACNHDDELTPAEGMRYCDATRRIFRHAFTE